ncbi:ABC transporter F family member 3 [Fulvia fulva]|nr:ABC transporter F family member 3 [Fulvia fulva]
MPTKRNKEQSAGDVAGTLTVSAQQSRFHTEMDEDSNLKEIVVKDLNISIGNRELLSHANFQLQRGRHYVLHGRNGIGKSTLLRAIATDQISSIPRGVKVLLLGQTESTLEEDMDAIQLEDLTVLQYVVRSDATRERLLHKSRLLSAALDMEDPTAAVRAYRRVAHERLEKRLADVKQIAKRRSGARGKEASKVQLRLEGEVDASAARLTEPLSVDEISDETQKSAEMLSEVQTSLELMDASGAEAKARSVLLGLGFSKESIDQPRSQLSGGWRTRCSLACALCQSADLLLLDEPTNFLDLPPIIWLERYIQSMDDSTTVLVVSHDRAFGDEVADELLVLREQQLERFRGNLSAYETDRLKQYKYLSRMKDALDIKKKHIQSSIDSNMQAVKRAGDDKKLKQAASRKKKLEDRMGMELSAKGGRFKLNRDLAGYHDSNRAEIELPKFDPPATMTIPTQPPDLRFPGSLVSFENVSFKYGNRPILTDINLTIHPGDRIGLAGLNGSGKSTLVSLAIGTTPASSSDNPITPTSGTIHHHTRARTSLYSQQSPSDLSHTATSNPTLTALSHLLQHAGPDLTEQPARALLSGVGLSGKVASDIPISLLSGGQRVRLALARLFINPPHLLILDEVTTHLDTDTIQALISALRNYEGAILVVTHDRVFMKTVVEGMSLRALAGSSRDGDGDEEEGSESERVRRRVVFRLSKGRLVQLERGMEQYEEVAERSAGRMGKGRELVFGSPS